MTPEVVAEDAVEDREVEDQAPLREFLDPGAPALLLAFGGYSGGLPMFEFVNVTKAFSAQKVYVRDLLQTWYHAGLPGVHGGVRGVADLLYDVVQRARPQRAVFIGNSMGGYAALAVGWLLAPRLAAQGIETRVIGFAAQTFLSRWLRFRHADPRWWWRMRATRRAADARGRALFDLRQLQHFGPGPARADLFACAHHRLDRAHALRVSNLPNVHVHLRESDGPGHAVIKHMRASGELGELLAEAIGFAAVTEIPKVG